MEIRILIQTIPGKAIETGYMLRRFLNPSGKTTFLVRRAYSSVIGKQTPHYQNQMYANADNDICVWVLHGDSKFIHGTIKSVAGWHAYMKLVLNDKRLLKKLSETEAAELERMFTEETSISVLKRADYEQYPLDTLRVIQ